MNPADKKCLVLVCGFLRREIDAAVKEEHFADVEVASFPCDCGRPSRAKTGLRELLAAHAARYDHVIVVGGPCQAPSEAAMAVAGNVSYLKHCFDLFLPTSLIRKLQEEGAYLMTPGWLEGWERQIRDWGFDQATARDFFAESCSRLILLDSGVSPRSLEQLAAFAAFVGRSGERLPVGLDMLRLLLRSLVLEWRGMPRPPGPQLAADYAMIFDMLGRLVGSESEEQVIRALFAQFTMICAPATQRYRPFMNGQAGDWITEPASAAPGDQAGGLAAMSGDRAWSETATGFTVRLRRDQDTLGILQLDDFSLPQHRERYLNLTLSILPMLELAVANARNIRQLAHAQALALENGEKYRDTAEELTHIYQNVPSIILLIDNQLRVRKANRSALDLAEREGVDRVINRRAGDALRCLHALAAPEGCGSGKKCGECLLRRTILDTLITGQEHDHVEISLPLHTAEVPPVFLLSTTRLQLHSEHLVLVSILDITAHKQLEIEKEELQARNQQLQRSESLGRMAGAIAHLFNNQLQSVMGNLELALEEPHQNESGFKLLTAALQSAREASEISKLMLVYVGQTLGRRERIDLTEHCRQDLCLLETLKPGHVTLTTDFPSSGPTINVNPNQLRQILTHVITNAWEAISTGTGTVHLAIRTVAGPSISSIHRFPLDWQPLDQLYACLEVADTGTGIAPADIDKVFDPFYSSKFIGRGLGLSVALGFVRSHEGGLRVDSVPRKGSRFYIYFPVA